MRSTAVLLTLILWAFLLASGCAGEQEEDNTTQELSTTTEQTELAASQPVTAKEYDQESEPEQEPSTTNLSGNGPTGTEPFELESGLSVFHMTYQGERNFIVWLLDRNGVRVTDGLLANQMGSFKGSKAVQTKGGPHVLDVQASGPWTITIEQPRPTNAPRTASYTYETTKTATEFFELTRGVRRFEMSHRGDRNFIVWLLDKNGAKVPGGLVANEQGPFEGSRAIQVPKDDIYLLQVEANGPWVVQVEEIMLGAQ